MRRALILILISGAFAGCYKKEWEAEKAANAKLQADMVALRESAAVEKEGLKKQIDELMRDNAGLKETPQSDFQRGKDLFSAGRYSEAAEYFNKVIANSPSGPLASSAKKVLAAANRAAQAQSRANKALEANCQGFLTSFSDSSVQLIEDNARAGRIPGSDISTARRIYKECRAACKGASSDCLGRARAAMEAVCGSSDSIYPSARPACVNLAAKYLNQIARK